MSLAIVPPFEVKLLRSDYNKILALVNEVDIGFSLQNSDDLIDVWPLIRISAE